jgi:hypothetical protein
MRQRHQEQESKQELQQEFVLLVRLVRSEE